MKVQIGSDFVGFMADDDAECLQLLRILDHVRQYKLSFSARSSRQDGIINEIIIAFSIPDQARVPWVTKE